MHSISKIGLPLLQTEPACDWIASKQQPANLYFCYACHRDFLSVPNTHQIIQLIGTKSHPASIQLLSEIDFKQLIQSNKILLEHSENEPGLYLLASEAENNWLLFDKESVFKLTFSRYNHYPQSYYHLSAEEALNAFLQTSG